MEIKFIPLTHAEVPVNKVVTIDGKEYAIEVLYNSRKDFYTMTLMDSESSEIIYCGKLTYLSSYINGPAAGVDITSAVVPLNIEDVLRDTVKIGRISAENFDTMKVALL